MTFRIKAVGETARVFHGGVRENPGCFNVAARLAGGVVRQVAGNLVQGFLKCKKIIEIFLLNFLFCFCAEKLSRKNKKLSEQTDKKPLAVNLQSPRMPI
ncbi:hypothetical protein ACCM60_08040 [Pseudomonas chlororaphis subsp. aureofaciens]|uniref:hypothetical protein n=1 Tax=Pseudomonas chlororaphis TaxID=587753 RepID=UPI0012679459|nr:hypothetical protein [Pseudomonas chlororaphis]